MSTSDKPKISVTKDVEMEGNDEAAGEKKEEKKEIDVFYGKLFPI